MGHYWRESSILWVLSMPDVSLRLIRHTSGPKFCVGTLLLPGHVPLVTLERPWVSAGNGGLENWGMPNKSCLPTGRYKLSFRWSPSRNRRAWYLSDPDAVTVRNEPLCKRWGIMVHPANRAEELQGCIALGLREWEPGVLQGSAQAVSDFEGVMERLAPDGLADISIEGMRDG